MKNPPAFQFYPADFMIGVMGMTDEEIGIYMKMLCTQWMHGSLPNCPKTIKKLVNSCKKPSEIVLEKFDICEDGQLRNLRMESVREKQKKFAESRQNNANTRWKKDASAYASAMLVHNASICTEDALQSSSSNFVSTLSKDKVKRRKISFDPSSVELPFDSGDFKHLWESWTLHRKDIKKPITERSAKEQLSLLGKMSEAQAITSIRQSIANGWTGLFEPKQNRNGNFGNQSKPATYDERNPNQLNEEFDLSHITKQY